MAFTSFPSSPPFQSTNSLTEKNPPVGADEVQIADSEDSYSSKKLSLTNLLSLVPTPSAGASVIPIDWTYDFTSNSLQYWPAQETPGSPRIVYSAGGYDGSAILHTFSSSTQFAFFGEFQGLQANTVIYSPYADGSIPTGFTKTTSENSFSNPHNSVMLYAAGSALATDRLLIRIDAAAGEWDIRIRGLLLIW